MDIGRFILSASFSMGDGLAIAGIVILLCFSAFSSGCETSFSSVNTMRIKTLAENRVKGARRAQYICDHFDFALCCFLVMNNLINIANTTICAYIFAKFIANPTLANIINTIVMTIIILVFTEITPKAYAKHNPEKFVLKFSGLVFVVMKIMGVLAFPFYKLQKVFIKGENEVKITGDEFENIVDTMEVQGVIDSENADIIHGALDISEKTVYDIFVPRVDMIAMPVYAKTSEIKKAFAENQFSRLPIYEGDKDNIVGILNFKDFFVSDYESENYNLKDYLTKPLKVTEIMKVDELIKYMQKEKKHIAIVVDEYGGTSGIVTMEDAIEEMIGEIYDEHDKAIDAPIQKLEDDKYKVLPDVSVEDLFEFLEIEHLPETSYSSVGGMVYELSETLPKKGTIVSITVEDDVLDKNKNYITIKSNLTFNVEEFDDDRIQSIIVTVKKENFESKIDE
ncbi:MAG: HlyC/CorC family transporter [Clostridia bacterium]|nr:HlyC/CorC family transporter [Clostridia bacterium]